MWFGFHVLNWWFWHVFIIHAITPPTLLYAITHNHIQVIRTVSSKQYQTVCKNFCSRTGLLLVCTLIDLLPCCSLYKCWVIINKTRFNDILINFDTSAYFRGKANCWGFTVPHVWENMVITSTYLDEYLSKFSVLCHEVIHVSGYLVLKQHRNRVNSLAQGGTNDILDK